LKDSLHIDEFINYAKALGFKWKVSSLHAQNPCSTFYALKACDLIKESSLLEKNSK